MNRVAPIAVFAVALLTAGIANAQHYTTYYHPTTTYYQPATVYYQQAAAPLDTCCCGTRSTVATTMYNAPVTTTYYAPATTTYYAATPTVVYYPTTPRYTPWYRWW